MSLWACILVGCLVLIAGLILGIWLCTHQAKKRIDYDNEDIDDYS